MVTEQDLTTRLAEVTRIAERAMHQASVMKRALERIEGFATEALASEPKAPASPTPPPDRVKELEEAYSELLAASELALDHGNFRNGVTDSTGSIDEGEVRIGGRLSDAIRRLRSLLAVQP